MGEGEPSLSRYLFISINSWVMRRLGLLLTTLVIAGIVILGSYCTPNSKQESSLETYRNLSDSASYVGINTCKQCHVEVHSTFQHTGMGLSFDKASKSKSSAKLDEHSTLYDTLLDLYYHPYWNADKLFLKEYRLMGEDTVHNRVEQVDYIIGSGQHTNSHIFNTNGYLHQMPFTYYTQDGKLDFPPGFENGQNTRFSRKIGLECMTCHNSYPKFVLGSENKFDEVPIGINCERCHGPGSLHVKDKMAGKFVDTAKYIDYSIVNPGKLSIDLQFEVCQRCHLQGNAVLQEGKTFFDFKPGMYLKEVMDVYTPRFSDSDENFIMASHVDRLKSSACFLQSNNTLNCITCHNPHVSVKQTDNSIFNNKCQSCHNTLQAVCPEVEAKSIENANCVSCHMPKSGSEDIPHVRVTDHKIQIPKDKNNSISDKERVFLNLYCINNANPSVKSKAKAYLQQYEKFNADLPQLLDSAAFYINQLKIAGEETIQMQVHLNYLKNNFLGIITDVEAYGKERLLGALKGFDYDNADAWVAYRVGQAYQTQYGANSPDALRFYKEAVDLAPLALDFIEKYAIVLAQNGRVAEAMEKLKQVLAENPNRPEALNNLGYLYVGSTSLAEAELYFDKAIALNPNYLQALLNKTSVLLQENKKEEAKRYLQRILKIAPDHEQARYILDTIESL